MSAAMISASPRRSASVTGLSSVFVSTVTPVRQSGRMTALAASTISASLAPMPATSMAAAASGFSSSTGEVCCTDG